MIQPLTCASFNSLCTISRSYSNSRASLLAISSTPQRLSSLCVFRRPFLHFTAASRFSSSQGDAGLSSLCRPRGLSETSSYKAAHFHYFSETCCNSSGGQDRHSYSSSLSFSKQFPRRLHANSAAAELNKTRKEDRKDVCLTDVLLLLQQQQKQQQQELEQQQENKDSENRHPSFSLSLPATTPIISFDSFEGYRRQILHLVELAVGPRRKTEFRSLRLVNRSMCGLHAVFLLLLATSPPTSLELLLPPHAQFCCLSAAQSAAVTFWGFGIAKRGPLSSKGLAVLDWRLLMGLLYLFVCTCSLVASFKDPQTAYALNIAALLLLLLQQQQLGLPAVAAVPSWWSSGSNRVLLLMILACSCLAWLRAVYVQRKFEYIMRDEVI